MLSFDEEVKQSQPACVNYSLTLDEEMEAIKVAVGEFSKQSRAHEFQIVFHLVNIPDLNEGFRLS